MNLEEAIENSRSPTKGGTNGEDAAAAAAKKKKTTTVKAEKQQQQQNMSGGMSGGISGISSGTGDGCGIEDALTGSAQLGPCEGFIAFYAVPKKHINDTEGTFKVEETASMAQQRAAMYQKMNRLAEEAGASKKLAEEKERGKENVNDEPLDEEGESGAGAAQEPPKKKQKQRRPKKHNVAADDTKMETMEE